LRHDTFDQDISDEPIFFRASIIGTVKVEEEPEHIIAFAYNELVTMALKPFRLVSFIERNLNPETT